MRLALEWAIDNDPGTALRLAYEFSWIWFMRGTYLESQHWLKRGLARASDIPDDLRAGTLSWIGGNAVTQGEYGQARAPLEEALAIYFDLGDDYGSALTLHALGRAAMFSGDSKQAVSLYESAIDLWRRHNDPSMTVTLSNLGGVLFDLGKLDQAATVLDEALEQAERHGHDWHRAQILSMQGLIALTRDDLPGARRTLRRCIELDRGARDLRFVAQDLEACAFLATTEGAASHAARLLGAASRMRELAGVPVPPSVQRDHDRYVPLAKAQIDADEWDRAWLCGRDLSRDEAIDLALQGLE